MRVDGVTHARRAKVRRPEWDGSSASQCTCDLRGGRQSLVGPGLKSDSESWEIGRACMMNTVGDEIANNDFSIITSIVHLYSELCCRGVFIMNTRRD